MTEIAPGSLTGPLAVACCVLPDCAQPLHMVITSDIPLHASTTDAELATPVGGDCTWEVRCEAGHVLLVPVDDGEDSHTFGQCRCDPECRACTRPGYECAHSDMERLRKVVVLRG
jgi:hypothetical protein